MTQEIIQESQIVDLHLALNKKFITLTVIILFMPKRSKQVIAKEFEEQVKRFMEKMQFSDREGSDSFKIDP